MPARHVYALESGSIKTVVDGDDASKTILQAPASFGEEALYPDDEQRVTPSDGLAWAGAAWRLPRVARRRRWPSSLAHCRSCSGVRCT